MKRATNDTTKLAPHSIESEVALLGSVLIDPCVMESLCVIEPDDFFIIKNGWVWSALQRLYKSKEPIDFLMVCNALDNDGHLEEAGGPAFISNLICRVPTAIHAEGYGRIVKQTSIRRKMLGLASDIAVHAYSEDNHIGETIEGIQKSVIRFRADASLFQPRITRMSADSIMQSEYTPIYYAVPGLLPAGLTFLSGRQKIGKSWLSLQLCGAIASGGKMFNLDVPLGPVLYCALEDTPRRIKARTQKQLWTLGLPVDFIFSDSFESEIGDMTKGGSDRLLNMIAVEGYKLVIIDPFNRAIGQFLKSGDANDSSVITKALSPLQRAAVGMNSSIVMVDHHSKASGSNLNPDAMNDMLGSVSKGGVADAGWSLYKERGKFGAKLQIVGRDIEEDKMLALEFDKNLGIWHCNGDACDIDMTNRKQEILDALKELCRAREVEIADFVSQPRSNTHNRLADLVNEGKLRRIQEDNKVFYELREL